MSKTPSLDSISTKQERIAELSRQVPKMAFTNLAHYIDVDFLREAFRQTRRNGAPGVDGKTWDDYEKDLETNLASLLNRFKSGRYEAPPVRRQHIPKGSGSDTRPIGIPTIEDKLLQRAVKMILEHIYEQDFHRFSHGFRCGYSAHGALKSIREQAMSMSGGWVIDLDIKGFFDALVHQHLRDFLDIRVRDGVIRRVIGKWLKAGVMESGELSFSESGTPQGGVISPLLANVYLHHVLDDWFLTEVQPRLRGQSFMVRYADDVVIFVEHETEAHRMMEVLPKRLGRFGLTMHPTKTRLVPFSKPPFRQRAKGKDDDAGPKSPETFDFLGFTHYWGRTRKGGWAIKRKTAKDRFQRSLTDLNDWCRTHRHWSIAAQHAKLTQKLKGHCGYFGITGNSRRLSALGFCSASIWRKWLNRRSQRKSMPWGRFYKLLERYPLPKMRAVHSVLIT
ncbi:MAG: group II intron reverse transcriptase/maturase [Planctomycetota bacterium]